MQLKVTELKHLTASLEMKIIYTIVREQKMAISKIILNSDNIVGFYKLKITTAYFIIPSHQTVFLYVYFLSLLGNGSVNIPKSFLGSGSVKTLPPQ
jgi:hypothetical protein